MKEVFITYSWDNEDHNQKVISFTDFLREKGFNAEIDRMYSQQETAADFKKMMHKAMTDYEKVIVVLSPGYKIKAEAFKGGVGTEYNLIIKDIEEAPNKYILVSFLPLSNDIIPLSFRDREILDLNNSENLNSLYAKLMNEKIYHFKEVGGVKPKIFKKEIPNFLEQEDKLNIEKIVSEIEKELPNFSVQEDSLTIEKIVSKMSTSHTQGDMLKVIDFDLNLFVKNNSTSSISDITVEISYPLWLTGFSVGGHVDGDVRKATIEDKSKFYPNQSKPIQLGSLSISFNNAVNIDSSSIKIKIFSDIGLFEKEFRLSEILLYRNQYGQVENLTSKHFTERY